MSFCRRHLLLGIFNPFFFRCTIRYTSCRLYGVPPLPPSTIGTVGRYRLRPLYLWRGVGEIFVRSSVRANIRHPPWRRECRLSVRAKMYTDYYAFISIMLYYDIYCLIIFDTAPTNDAKAKWQRSVYRTNNAALCVLKKKIRITSLKRSRLETKLIHRKLISSA